MRLMSITTGTDSLELVTSVLILLLYHPLHVVQQAAMLDNISGGRPILGIGLGYVKKKFDAFDVPMDERTGRMIALMDGMKFFGV